MHSFLNGLVVRDSEPNPDAVAILAKLVATAYIDEDHEDEEEEDQNGYL